MAPAEAREHRPVDRAAAELFLAAPRVRRLMEIHARENADELRVGVQQYFVLRMLRRTGPRSSSELVGGTYTSKQTLSELVDSMVGAGLLTREQDPEDRRKVVVMVTPEGVRVAEQFERSQLAMLHELLEGVPESDLEQIANGLAALNSALSVKRETGELMRIAHSSFRAGEPAR